jgi:O-antigen/teichoic acid export membrane protein
VAGLANKTQGYQVTLAAFDSTARTKAVKFHVSLTFVYRALAIGLSLSLVPLTIDYLGIEQFGVWMVILSVMIWVTFFDIGLGHGLRNKLAEALAANDIGLARKYVSTACLAISFIAFTFFVILAFAVPFAPWDKIFNTTAVSNPELAKVVFVIGTFVLLNFVLLLSNQVFFAYQKASFAALQPVLLNFFVLVAVLVLTHHAPGNLFYLALFYGLSMTLSSFLLLSYFVKKHSEVMPSVKYIDLSKIKELTSLGVKFFIIQIASLVIFTTDNMIITQVLGPEYVTPYAVVFNLFSIITIGHTILVTPLWSAYTDAYSKGDIRWIRSVLKKLNLLMIPVVIVVLLLVLFARDIISIWVGPEIEVSNLLVKFMGVFVVVSVWSNIYAYFVNGIGKVKPQLFSSIVAALINIPLSVYFAEFLGMGPSGVILGTIASLSLFAIIGPIQTYLILRPPIDFCINNGKVHRAHGRSDA